MRKYAGQIALAAGLVGIISGGVWAGSHAFAPVAPKPTQVQFVQQSVAPLTPSVTTTTATTVAPKPVAPKPVQSVKAKAPAVVAPVQRQAVVSDPTPTDTTPAPVPPPAPGQAPAPIMVNGATPPSNGQFGPGQGTPTHTP